MSSLPSLTRTAVASRTPWAYRGMVKLNHRRGPAVYTVTDAPRPMSEDIGHRQRRYLMSMTVRTVCFVGAIVAAVAGVPVWGVLILLAFDRVPPSVAVIIANGGRGPGAPDRKRV